MMAESRRPPYIKSNKKYLHHLSLFIASVLVVVVVSPRTGKFRYEFQKGKPWHYASLIAPWNFPIQKPDYQITHERDSILKNFTPYFKKDDEVEKKQIGEFDKLLYNLLQQFESQSGHFSPMTSLSIRRDLNSILSGIYQRGILENNELLTSEKIPSDITVIVGKVGEKKQITAVLTQKNAYQHAEASKNELVKKYSSESGNNISKFLSQVTLYDYIKPNLYYDDVTTNKVRNEIISELSLYKGLIQEGELIISRGEIVKESKFIVLESLRNEYEKRLGENDRWLIIMGRFILVTICYLALYLFLYHYRFDVISSTHKTFFIILLILLFILITRFVIIFPGNIIYLVPFAIIPIVIRTFYDSRLALFVYLIAIMLAGFIVPNSFEFVFLSYMVGVIVIFSLTNVYRRAKLFFAVFMVFLTYSIVYFGIGLMQEGSLENMSWKNYLWFAGNGVFLLLSYPLIFVFEKTFRFLSDATLFELADTNQPLLRKLADEAPGSFQHSLQVANLAEEAAREIGANTLLARTGALYHDIGKTFEAEYFIENQAEGYSPHNHLDPMRSSEIIISHVTKGVDLARKFNLPSPIIDFIQTHHGTSVAYFFYKKYLDSNPNRTDMERTFAYKGPKPFSKETAVVMMADAVEASSRSVANYSEENINELVERIIYLQENDGQFAEAPLTFKDISRIKDVFIKRLSNIYHARIAYPKR